jgi:glycosyltransferase involved in cell wall biosynthesis
LALSDLAAHALNPQHRSMAKVSCLMVTRAVSARREAMRRVVEAYARQSHADRELVIVLDGGDDLSTWLEILASADRTDIRIIPPEQGLTLGALRNISVAEARGEIVCQWDDDDLYHPDRIAAQLGAMTEARGDACLLGDVMIHRAADNRLRWLNWAAAGGGHPGTLLCARTALSPYPDIATKEDSAVLDQLRATRAVHVLAGAPHLYVYVTHGDNVSGDAHHAMLADRLSLSRGLLLRREQAIRAGLAPLAPWLDGALVEGANGLAFTL